MSSQTIKTNNDPKAFEHKVQLRLNSLPEKQDIKVLECFGGEGLLWKEVIKRSDKNISVLSIDIKKYDRFQLQGDSLKVLKTLSLNHFDIIDLDSYGIPFAHMQIVFQKRYSGIVHCTVIQSMMGNLPNGLMDYYGYSKGMIKKCRTLLSKNGIDKFLSYIASKGVTNIQIYKQDRKNYFWFYLHK